MKMIQTFFTKVHTWKDTVHSNYTAILMRKEGENRHHFSYCCWCLIIIKSFQKENSHALVLHCQMQMLLFLLVKLSLFGRQKRACGSENHHFFTKYFSISIKMSHLNFSFIFGPIKSDISGNFVWPQASVFQKLVNFEWDFFCDFQTPCYGVCTNLLTKTCVNNFIIFKSSSFE